MRKNCLFMLSIGLIFLPALSHTQQQAKYSIILNGNKAGFYEEEKLPDNTYKGYYWLNDRGRGDSLHVTWQENEAGFITELETTGCDYYKNPVAESFSMKDGLATWQNQSEKETRRQAKDAYYIPLSNIGGEITRTLLMSPDKQIDLLPYGSASIELLGTHSFTHFGTTVRYQLIAVKGMGFTPNYIWLDEQGKMFASVGDWASQILEGYEDLIPELLALQNAEESRIYDGIRETAVESPGVMLIRNVRLFEARTGKIIPKSSVLVKDGRITQVTSRKIRPPQAAKVIDGQGMTLIPGLIDMHVHFQGNFDGALHLANGVTGVRDLGNNFGLLETRKKVEKGEILGPTIERIAGLLDGKGPFAGPTPALAATEAEALAWVDTFARKGYDQVKIYSSVKPEWVPAITRKAKSYGMRVSGHIPAYMTAEQAVNAGYDEIQHMNMIFLNFYGDTIDTRSPNRFRIPAQKAASFDFNSPECKAFLKLLKDKGTVVDPTVSIFINMFTDRPGKIPVGYEAVVNRFPLTVQRYFRSGGGGLPVPDGMDETYKQSAEAFLKMVKLLYDNGIPIVAGTDNLAGFTLHLEMENYVKAGIPPNEVLKIATLGNATVLGRQSEIGSIEPGKRANLVLIDGDPTRNISDIRRVKWVLRDGLIYDPVKILNGLSIRGY
ncbi:MAG: amidohydrolase family protein [Lewinellaceae bacterium]|nr:amidohydrolase family protein [Lewinella sp.]MCB9279269.1 amidohydrolase family protein [Lewinellaceae bacterium]